MENFLTVNTPNGDSWQLLVLDIFTANEYPDKKYIAYTFGEHNDEMVQSYISVLNENNDEFSLDDITDVNEKNFICEYYFNNKCKNGGE